MRADEFAHHADAFRIVEDDDTGAVLSEEVFRAPKVPIFSNDNAGNTEQQRRARTHNAGAERAHQRQLSPITPASRVAQADGLGVRGGVATLHSQVVSSGDDFPVLVRQNGADRQASLAQTGPRFFDSLEQ